MRCPSSRQTDRFQLRVPDCEFGGRNTHRAVRTAQDVQPWTRKAYVLFVHRHIACTATPLEPVHVVPTPNVPRLRYEDSKFYLPGHQLVFECHLHEHPKESSVPDQ